MTKNRQEDAASLVRPRIALIAGTLGQAGAEKQLVYMARALRQAGAELRVYSLTKGEFYEAHLRELGVEPIWFGRKGKLPNCTIPLRLMSLASQLVRFRPHVVQSAHFFCNLYAGLCGRLSGALTLGAMRNDLERERKGCGRWTRASLRLPSTIIANSRAARRGVEEFGIDPQAITVLNNVVDLDEFDLMCRSSAGDAAWEEDGRTDCPGGRAHVPRKAIRSLPCGSGRHAECRLPCAASSSGMVRAGRTSAAAPMSLAFCQTACCFRGDGSTCQPSFARPTCSSFPRTMRAARMSCSRPWRCAGRWLQHPPGTPAICGGGRDKRLRRAV